MATPASASPNPVTGTSTDLSVLGADDAGESNLTYTWSTTGTPPAAVTFLPNGSNAAQNTTATFSQAGSYDFLVTITDAGGLSTTSSLTVTVDQTVTTVQVSPAAANINAGGTQQFSATALDQFNLPLANQPAFQWTTTVGTIDDTGLVTAPPFSASGTVTATSGAAQRHGLARGHEPAAHRGHPGLRLAKSRQRYQHGPFRPRRRRCRRVEPHLHLVHAGHSAGRSDFPAQR